MLRRSVLKQSLAALCAAAAAVATVPAHAQAYPTKPVRVILPFPAGGSTDVTARIVVDELSKSLGQPVIVENKPGANGNIAAGEVARAAPDGHTLLFATIGIIAINPSLYKLPFDPLKDFTPLATAAVNQTVLVVHPSVPADTLQQLIALAKAKPGQISYASTGSGGIAHVAGEMLKRRAGIQMLHVSYKGAAPALQDLIGGQVQVMFDTPATSTPHIQSGKLKAIAIPAAKRYAGLPSAPTFAEAGLPDFEAAVWNGFVGPKGMPEPVVAKLNGEINRLLQRSDVREKLAKQGLEALALTPQEFGARIRADVDRYSKIIKAAGIKVD